MSAPRQLAFRWPHSPSHAREDFLSAPSNLDALTAIELWPNWGGRMLMLLGPEGAGKSHLGAIWARAAEAIPPRRRGAGSTEPRGMRRRSRGTDRRRGSGRECRGASISLDQRRPSAQRVAPFDVSVSAGFVGPQHSRPPVATPVGAYRAPLRTRHRVNRGSRIQDVQRPSASG